MGYAVPWAAATIRKILALFPVLPRTPARSQPGGRSEARFLVCLPGARYTGIFSPQTSAAAVKKCVSKLVVTRLTVSGMGKRDNGL